MAGADLFLEPLTRIGFAVAKHDRAGFYLAAGTEGRRGNPSIAFADTSIDFINSRIWEAGGRLLRVTGLDRP